MRKIKKICFEGGKCTIEFETGSIVEWRYYPNNNEGLACEMERIAYAIKYGADLRAYEGYQEYIFENNG